MRGARAGSYTNLPLDDERNDRRDADRYIFFILMREMLGRIGDHEVGRGNDDPAMTEVYRQLLHEIVAGDALAGEHLQPTLAEEANIARALDTVQDVAEAAHLGGLITQEWTEAFELGEFHSAVAFDLGDIAEPISTTYGMSVEYVRADFWDWPGIPGPDIVADLERAWLTDHAGRLGAGGRLKTEARDSGGTA